MADAVHACGRSYTVHVLVVICVDSCGYCALVHASSDFDFVTMCTLQLRQGFCMIVLYYTGQIAKH